MGFRSKLALIHLRYPCGHQLSVANRPRRGSAHCHMSDPLHWPPVEVAAVLDQFDDVEQGLARDRANDRKHGLRAETVTVIKNSQTHPYSFSVAASRAASAVSYCRVD